MLLLTVGACVKSKINYSYTTFYYDKIEYRPTILYFYVIYARSEDYYYVFFVMNRAGRIQLFGIVHVKIGRILMQEINQRSTLVICG